MALATRITSAFGGGAETIGVFFERPAVKGRTASPGWYKSAAFSEAAEAAGLYAKNFNGDAFSQAMKDAVIDHDQSGLGASGYGGVFAGRAGENLGFGRDGSERAETDWRVL